MAQTIVVSFDISEQLSKLSQNRNKAFLKQRCLLKDELRTHGHTLM